MPEQAPTATAGDFRAIWGAQFKRAMRLRGAANAMDGTLVPRVTRREAIAILDAWRGRGAPGRNWSALAAIAYGMECGTDPVQERPDALYPIEWGKDLWLWVQRAAQDLDDAREVAPADSALHRPTIALRYSAWTDPRVRRELRGVMGGSCIADVGQDAPPAPTNNPDGPRDRDPADPTLKVVPGGAVRTIEDKTGLPIAVVILVAVIYFGRRRGR